MAAKRPAETPLRCTEQAKRQRTIENKPISGPGTGNFVKPVAVHDTKTSSKPITSPLATEAKIKISNPFSIGSKLNPITIQDDTRCLLLELPPELRHLIFEFALSPRSPFIEVTSQLPHLPPLLSTSRQLRNEAMKPFFATNPFCFKITACDATTLLSFYDKIGVLGRKYNEGKPLEKGVMVGLRGNESVKNWGNLVKWCHAVWRNRVPPLNSAAHDTAFQKVVKGAHEIACQCRKQGRAWAECELALATVRVMVGGMDPDWLK